MPNFIKIGQNFLRYLKYKASKKDRQKNRQTDKQSGHMPSIHNCIEAKKEEKKKRESEKRLNEDPVHLHLLTGIKTNLVSPSLLLLYMQALL